jgi:hypothetical protein
MCLPRLLDIMCGDDCTKIIGYDSVADPGSLILTFIHPGSQILDPESRTPVPGPPIQQQQQKRRGYKICCLTFFASTNFTKLKNFYVWTGTEKNLNQRTKNYSTFYQKIVT